MTNFSRALIAFALIASTPALAAGDAAKGKAVFNRCAICHNDTKGAGAKVGPNLWGVVGRKAGTQPGFNYSSALKGSGIMWTPDKLSQWVRGPQRMVPGTRMMFAGLSSQGQADDVVAYLKTLK